jgi:DNA adenine methylase
MPALKTVLPTKTSAIARPLVKWVGGKRQLLHALVPLLPTRWNRYFEPFSGGAALFFAVEPKRAMLCDMNNELINAYSVVRDKVEDVIECLQGYPYERDFFMRIRAQDPSVLDEVARAARFLYLNRTCFNGLYRVNSRGQFNVPFGRYVNPRICDPARFRAAAGALGKAELHVADFAEVEGGARRGDFLYFDPPYIPASATSSFTAYTSASFGMSDQQRLADLFRRLHRKGCKLMLSNSDLPLVDELYAGFQIERVAANRAINSRATGRGAVGEVIVRNYA